MNYKNNNIIFSVHFNIVLNLFLKDKFIKYHEIGLNFSLH